MKKFLQTKLAHCSLLLIAIFCFFSQGMLKAQLPTCIPPVITSGTNGVHKIANESSRLVASIEEVNDSLVAIQVIAIGKMLAEDAMIPIYYNSLKLKMVDTTLLQEYPLQEISHSTNIDPLVPLKIDPKLIARGNWEVSPEEHRASGITDFEKHSYIQGMNLYYGGVWTPDMTPYSNYNTKINVDSAQIFPLYTFYLVKKGIYKGSPLTNADIGFGNLNVLVAPILGYWSYAKHYVMQEEHAWETLFDGLGVPPDVVRCRQSDWFNFRNPSKVEALTPTLITEETATLQGKFSRMSCEELLKSDTMLSGVVFDGLIQYYIDGSTGFPVYTTDTITVNEGILRYDTIINYGYIYSTDSSFFSVDKFSDILKINGVASGMNLALGNGTYTYNGKDYH